MEENTVVVFQNPTDFQEDPLTEVLQAGVRKLLAQAVEAEGSVFLDAHAGLVVDAGRRRVVRNGYLPERAIQIGIGSVRVRQPRVRDRGRRRHPLHAGDPAALSAPRQEPGRPPAMAVSEGHLHRRLQGRLGGAPGDTQAPGLSDSSITPRLKEVWGG